ncbi:MAG: hypothetical protein WA324_19345 [Bryobacteraceae bacterium]
MVSREQLYELVWSMPMTKVAEKFSVSGSYMARVCSALRVPRPELGYWAKLNVGKAPARPALPEALPGDQLIWSQDGDLPLATRGVAVTSSNPVASRARRIVTGTHGLVRDAKQHYERGYKVEDGQLLRPYKRMLVDVIASLASLDKALSFANDLFNALESAGHRVCLAPSSERFYRAHIDEREEPKPRRQEYPEYGRHLWAPDRCTVVYVDTIPFGLTVIEMTESVVMRYVNGKYIRESDYKPPKTSRGYADHTWTTTEDLPCGRLRLVIYSVRHDVSWSISFQETKTRTLTEDIRKIVKSIEGSTELLRKEIAEAERLAEVRRKEQEAQHARWLIEEDQRQIARSIKESREELDEVIQSWAAAVGIEQFFKGVQERASNLPEDKRKAVVDRLQLARDFIGTQDPLDFFRTWKTPNERYLPRAMSTPRATPEPAKG